MLAILSIFVSVYIIITDVVVKTATISLLTQDPRVRSLLEAIHDPHCLTTAPGVICKLTNVTVVPRSALQVQLPSHSTNAYFMESWALCNY